MTSEPPERRRLDKWLHYARFAKTRTLAARLVTDGHVRVNGRRADSAAKGIAVGDVLTIAAAHRTAAVRVLSLGERRGPAPEAQGLYEDLSAGAGRDDGSGRDDAALVMRAGDA